MIDAPKIISPNWPAPSTIRAFTTTRAGGVSKGAYSSFNLAMHVQDQPQRVASNRKILRETFNLPAEPSWISQVHGTHVLLADGVCSSEKADGSYTRAAGVVCAVLTADCLPMLLCDLQGIRVAAVHVGWRGLAAGIVEVAVNALDSAPQNILVWFGPAIGPRAFEVGHEVYQTFVKQDPEAESAFIAFRRIAGKNMGSNIKGKWMANIYQLATLRLEKMGISAIYGGEHCTYSEADEFYSFRRDGNTGRMASLIWRES